MRAVGVAMSRRTPSNSKEVAGATLGSVRVRLRKMAAPPSDKEPVFGFVIHGGHRLPIKNAAGETFMTKDLVAMYKEAHQKQMGIE